MSLTKFVLLRLIIKELPDYIYKKGLSITSNGEQIWPENNKVCILEDQSIIKIDHKIIANKSSFIPLELWSIDSSTRILLGSCFIKPKDPGGPYVSEFKDNDMSSTLFAIEWGVSFTG